MSSVQGAFFLAAVSGTAVLLLALKLHTLIKPPPPPPKLHPPASPSLRPCISAGGKKGEKKRVRFAIDVAEPAGNNEDFRRRHSRREMDGGGTAAEVVVRRGMPANRVALYNGIMRDRGVHRLACSSYRFVLRHHHHYQKKVSAERRLLQPDNICKLNKIKG